MDLKIKEKLDALYHNDIEKIFKAYESCSQGEWYKWINDKRLLAIISPIKSNTVSKIVDTICNIVYEDVRIGDNNLNLKLKDLYEIETKLQLNGEIAIEWIPEVNNGTTTWNYEIFHEEKYFQEEEDCFTFIRYYGENCEYMLQTMHIGNTILNELYKIDNEKMTKVDLNSIEETKDIVEEIVIPNVTQTAFKFKTKNKLKDAIDWVLMIDEAMTFLNLGVRSSGNALAIEEDVGTTVGLNNPGTVVNQIIKDRMLGILKLPNQQGTGIESIQGEVLTEQYKEVRAIAIQEVLSIMGISMASYDYTNIGANASGEAISQRKDLTRRTRSWLINEREEQYMSMYEALGVSYDIAFATFKDMLPLDEQLKVMALVNGNMIPHEVGLLMIDSSLTEEEAREMAAKVNDNVSGLSLMTGVSGT